jgi:hypothetical protein
MIGVMPDGVKDMALNFTVSRGVERLIHIINGGDHHYYQVISITYQLLLVAGNPHK